MRQSFWHQTGNLWALALSTVIAMYLPPFGPENSMDDGVGVVIRTTIVAPIVFSLLYWGGRLTSWLAEKLIGSLNRLLRRWRMSIITAGFEEGMRNAVERRAKKIAPAMARKMARKMAEERVQAATEKAAKDKAQQQEAFIEYMRSKGVSDAEQGRFGRGDRRLYPPTAAARLNGRRKRSC